MQSEMHKYTGSSAGVNDGEKKNFGITDPGISFLAVFVSQPGPGSMKHRLSLAAAFLLSLVLGVNVASAAPAEECIYFRGGQQHTAASLREVPAPYRNTAVCAGAAQDLARANEIELQGNIRHEQVPFDLGSLELRWPRKVEELFGRTPLRAMTDSARTIARAVSRPGFPSFIQRLNIKWSVVFMDESAPRAFRTQLPSFIVSRCHPGWMVPPADIYIVAQRVAQGCSDQRTTASVADSTLTEVLLHEMGHVLEFQLLKGHGLNDHMRAEGFATWFQIYAAEFSSLANNRRLKEDEFRLARQAIQQSPDEFSFSNTGDPREYARASIYFHAIVSRRGIDGLMQVYEKMATDGSDFMTSIAQVLKWTPAQLNEQVRKIVGL